MATSYLLPPTTVTLRVSTRRSGGVGAQAAEHNVAVRVSPLTVHVSHAQYEGPTMMPIHLAPCQTHLFIFELVDA